MAQTANFKWIFLVVLLPFVFVGFVQSQSCGDPVGVANADIVTSSPYANGDYVTYRCFSSFVMSGTPSQQCVSGVWTGTLPVCTFQSKADVHEQTVDFTDSSTDNSMTIGLIAVILAVFIIMVVLMVLACCFMCRRMNCFRGDAEQPKAKSFQDVVQRVLDNKRHRPAKQSSGWMPSKNPMRDNNTSTK